MDCFFATADKSMLRHTGSLMMPWQALQWHRIFGHRYQLAML